MEQQHKIREDLQNRKITPSMDSWDRLNKKLTTHNNREKRNKWLFVKNASAILVLISIGFYFFGQKEEVINEPIVVSPTIKEESKKRPEIIAKPEIEVAESPTIALPKSNKIEQPVRIVIKNKANYERIALENPNNELEELKLAKNEPGSIDLTMISKEILEVETLSEEAIINAEIEQLLKNSQIKISKNRQILTKKVVSANELLLEVEDGLDKDLEQRILETIVKVLKNPKKVASTNRN